MPSIGVDVQAGRGWGFTKIDKLRALNLGCICFWSLGNASVVDQLTANQAALAAAREALKLERHRLENAVVFYRATDGRFLPVSKGGCE